MGSISRGFRGFGDLGALLGPLWALRGGPKAIYIDFSSFFDDLSAVFQIF